MNVFNTQKTEKSTTTWLTPPWMLEMLGPIDLDPCAAVGRPWDCATINYTVEDNGLALPWDGRPGQAPNAASCLVAWDRSERKLLRELERSGKGKMAIL